MPANTLWQPRKRAKNGEGKCNEMRHITCERGDAPRRRADEERFLFLLLSFAKATQNKRLSESSNGRISSAKPSQVKAQSVRQTQTLRNRHHCCSGSVVHSVPISDHVRLRINVITEMPRI